MTKNVNYSIDHTNRVPMNIHPEVRTRLAFLLVNDPRLAGTGIGYSEFMADAMDAFEAELWTPERSRPQPVKR